MSAWIEMISDEDAGPELAELLDLARTPHGTVDNVMRVHSLRPNTMKGHVSLYRAALHDEANTVPMWLQETISSYVSILNDCPYSLANHWKNAAHLIGDAEKSAKVEQIDGVDHFIISMGVTSDSHPFYTGSKMFVDTEGRIDKFEKRFGAVRRAGKPKLKA